jgi:two-component system KDP operon response regulator KdpE
LITCGRVTRAGQEIKLTRNELDLLSFLARHAGKVVTHQLILNAVWEPAHTEDTQFLRVHIRQLRQKIEAHADPISNEIWIGYRIAESK